MPKQVSPIDSIRAEIDTVFGSGRRIDECLEDRPGSSATYLRVPICR